MKFLRLALLALASLPAFALGSISSTCVQLGNSGIWLVTWNWTGDASTGSVPAGPAACLQTSTQNLQGFRLIAVETVPGSPAPMANYSATITDASGLDELNGLALNSLSATGPQQFNQLNNVPLSGILTLNISGNSVASAQGKVYGYMAPPAAARSGGGGGGGPQIVSALPSTCVEGTTYFLTTASAGSNIYGCTSPNTLTVQTSAGTGGANSGTSFSNATSVSIAGKGTPNVLVQCYDNNSPANQIGFNSLQVAQGSPYNVTVTFAAAQSGYCAVNAAGSGYIGNSSIDSSGNVSANSFTSTPSGNGCAFLPGSGGNTVSYCGTATQQGGTVDPPPFLNAGTVVQPYMICPPVTPASDTIASSTTPTETAFATTCSIPAGFLITGRTLKVTFGFSISSSATAAAPDFKLRLGASAGIGGTVIWDSTSVTVSNSMASRSGVFECLISGTGAAGSSVAIETVCGSGCASPTTPFVVMNTVAAIQDVATNAALILNPTVTYASAGSGSGTNQLQLLSMQALAQN